MINTATKSLQNVEQRTGTNVDVAQLDALFQEIGWKTRGAEKWREVLSKSSCAISMWENDRLIGFGRILEDGVMCMLYDIAIAPSHQKRGLGTRLMNTLIDQVKGKQYASIGLFAWEGNSMNISFYERFGFKVMPTGMECLEHMRRE